MTSLTLIHSDTEHACRNSGPDDLFVSHLETIHAAVAFAARRQRLTPEEREDFTSSVMVRLLENDCAILRKFQGRSSFKTYITIVVQRLLLDFRDAHWGKWRPSAKALRHGRIGVVLEILTMKRGMSIDQAWRLIQAKFHGEASRESLAAVHESLPRRLRRQFVGEDALQDLPAAGDSPEQQAAAGEVRPLAARVCAALEAGMSAMNPQDQVLLRMRYQRNLSVATIARQLSMDQKSLYRRYERLLADLRVRLKDGGVSKTQLLRVLGRSDIELAPVLATRDLPLPDSSNRCA